MSLASTILIYLYVSHELGFDSFHHHADRLYRVNQTFIWAEDSNSQLSRTGPGVANALKEELPEVELVTSLHTPGSFIVSHETPSGEIISFEENDVFAADTNFFKVLNFPLIKGDPDHAFRLNNPGDKDRVIMNEATVRKIGWALDESVIGKKITYPNNNNASFEVIGVVSDFNYWTLATPIEPMAMFYLNNETVFHESRRFIVLKIEPQSLSGWETTLAATEQLWKKHAGGTPFDYRFVDENFADTFKTQQQFGKVLTAMASLAILIASLGLLGMIVYALEQRSKEIGIRKVSGASEWDILVMISRGYTALIVLAFAIGAPFSYWLMNIWLADFAYRITPSIWVFALAGLSTLLVAMLITSYHSLKAAMTNPVDVLRDE